MFRVSPLSSRELAKFNLFFYLTLSHYNSNWKDVCEGNARAINNNPKGEFRKYALELIYLCRKYRQLALQEISNIVNPRNNTKYTIPSAEGIIIEISDPRSSKAWRTEFKGDVTDFVVACPSLDRILFARTRANICTDNLFSRCLLKNFHVYPMISRIAIDGKDVELINEKSALRELKNFYRNPKDADLASNSLKIIDEQASFDDFVIDPQNGNLSQFYVCSVKAKEVKENFENIVQYIVVCEDWEGNICEFFVSKSDFKKCFGSTDDVYYNFSKMKFFVRMLILQEFRSAEKYVLRMEKIETKEEFMNDSFNAHVKFRIRSNEQQIKYNPSKLEDTIRKHDNFYVYEPSNIFSKRFQNLHFGFNEMYSGKIDIYNIYLSVEDLVSQREINEFSVDIFNDVKLKINKLTCENLTRFLFKLSCGSKNELYEAFDFISFNSPYECNILREVESKDRRKTLIIECRIARKNILSLNREKLQIMENKAREFKKTMTLQLETATMSVKPDLDEIEKLEKKISDLESDLENEFNIKKDPYWKINYETQIGAYMSMGNEKAIKKLNRFKSDQTIVHKKLLEIFKNRKKISDTEEKSKNELKEFYKLNEKIELLKSMDYYDCIKYKPFILIEDDEETHSIASSLIESEYVKANYDVICKYATYWTIRAVDGKFEKKIFYKILLKSKFYTITPNKYRYEKVDS